RAADAPGGLQLLDQALHLDPRRPDLLARRADALLLCSREDEALAAYAQALPGIEPPQPDGTHVASRSVGPTWLRFLSRVAVPEAGSSAREADLRTLSNYASLLANKNCTAAAAALFERLCREDPADGYAWAALALIRTLNREWDAVVPAARQAKTLGAEVFNASMDMCLLSAA